MMDTVLNLGLNDRTVQGLAAASGDTALRLRQLPPLHPDVRGRRPRRGPLRVRGGARGPKQARGCRYDTDLDGAALAELVDHLLGIVAEATGKPSRRIRGSSSGGRSAPCSAPGRRRARSPIAACTTSPATWAPRSPCRRWCSATWATTAPPASPSPATPQPARSASTASSWSTPRARTWWPASARRSR